MPVRRHCDPANVKRIWDAIRSGNVARQACDVNRIFKFTQNVDDWTLAQVEMYIEQCLKDGLIVYGLTRRSVSDINSNVTYKITDQKLPQFDGKDWYCFECHLAGDVNDCSNCFRVFHPDCIQHAKRKFELHRSNTINLDLSNSNENDKYEFSEKLCNICNIINIEEMTWNKIELNYLLKFVLYRIRTWLPNTITHTMAAEDRPTWLTDTELTWRANQLFFEHRDMSVIEVNINTTSYSILSEFLADVFTVQHNVAIFHGIDSQEYQAAELMVRDALHDVSELKTCIDCYRHSNEKINARWFCLPCRNPHSLVWAKQKGYPYWPAKVIRETNTHCDVRYFGGKHERAMIHKSFVKPISVPKESLKITPSKAFTRSLEELIYHQKLLSSPEEVDRLVTEANARKPSRKTLPSLNISQATTSSGRHLQEGSKRKSSSSESSNKKPRINVSVNEISGNVINISDCEEEEEEKSTEYSFQDSEDLPDPYKFEDTHEPVSSSTGNVKSNMTIDVERYNTPLQSPAERMRNKLERLTDKKEIIEGAVDMLQKEVNRVVERHNEILKDLFESHNQQIRETKKRQWCYHCGQDAIYHCCWNTAYCSQICQQQHWQAEHKKVCRRKK
ncbi:hypothetical protein ABEB36_011747 [Hypothenemus hampei]|uniref:Zinc finger MYND domain-containing protein 11 n=1 Tax=Hypothenemus hampei TaxID=57062 RepID=A0ABD1E912_HYPHA